MKNINNYVWIFFIALSCVICPETVHGAKRARYQAIELKASGTITGVVRFDGKVPKREKLKVAAADKVCHQEPIFSEDLVVSDKKMLKWAVARIKTIARGKPFPKGPMGQSGQTNLASNTESVGIDAATATTIPSSSGQAAKKQVLVPVAIDQKGCRFVPHVAIVAERQPFKILNSDGILHNVHTYAKFNAPLNKAMQATVKEMDITFKRRERILVRCDIHNWMRAWIIVAEHPYYAVTGDDGVFQLRDVPVGTYTVDVWHETLGRQQKKVTVEANKEVKVEYVFKKK